MIPTGLIFARNQPKKVIQITHPQRNDPNVQLLVAIFEVRVDQVGLIAIVVRVGTSERLSGENVAETTEVGTVVGARAASRRRA